MVRLATLVVAGARSGRSIGPQRLLGHPLDAATLQGLVGTLIGGGREQDVVAAILGSQEYFNLA